MLRIVRAVARVQAARPCVAAVRSAHVVALPARLAAVAARPLAAARPGVAGVQWGGFRSTALAAADGDAPSRDQERSNQVRAAVVGRLAACPRRFSVSPRAADARTSLCFGRSSSAATCRSPWTARS
jgi:hypothetical protein